jgi:flagellar motor protein MotB
MRAAFVLVWAAITTAGCGIPEEVHTQSLRDLDKCRQDLASARGDVIKVSAQLEEATAPRNMSDDDPALGRPGSGPGEHGDDLAEVRRLREAGKRHEGDWQRVAGRLKPLVDAGALALFERGATRALFVPDRTLFDAGKADIKPEGKPLLTQIAQALRDVGDRNLLVGDRTAAAPVHGKFRSNWELSAARAVSIVQFLQGEGIDPRHMAAVGYSEFHLGEAEPGGRVEVMLMSTAADLFTQSSDED